MSWFEKLMPSRIKTERRTRSVPEGIWQKCSGCGAQLYRAELERNFFVCPKCEHHIRLSARKRLELFLDRDTGREIAERLSPMDPLKFKDSKKYRDRISQAQDAQLRTTDELSHAAEGARESSNRAAGARSEAEKRLAEAATTLDAMAATSR